jgi:iron(III) transport system ATP-binding protein
MGRQGMKGPGRWLQSPAMVEVRTEKITKLFGQTVALSEVSLLVKPGELFFLLGPSGCGKSTLLRLIAGLHEPTSGRLYFGERDVTALPTQERNAVMCFQSYALWPHMSVEENIRFGLDVRKVPPGQQKQRIAEVLRLVRMENLAARKPNQLSGGQQQRVALARALAVKPACLLLDEPLSNLDAKLRHDMRGEIRRICKEAGFTTIYVTHDQKEALSVADRIAVLKEGQLQQVGTPTELYHKPRTAFVADFIGATNLIRGEVIEQADGMVRVKTAVGEIVGRAGGKLPRSVIVSVRPEVMRIVRDGTATGRNTIVGKVVETTFLGESSEHVIESGGERIRVVSAPPVLDGAIQMQVRFGEEDVVVLEG